MHAADSIWTETAAWVEAIGAIAAVIGAGWVAARDSRAARGREERAEQEARREWEKNHRSQDPDTPREYEQDGADERRAS